MRIPSIAVAIALLCVTIAGPLRAEGPARTTLKPFKVTIRVFEPAKGVERGQDYVLPVDSPDAEHACASTLANAASFTTKTSGSEALPVAFSCKKVEPR